MCVNVCVCVCPFKLEIKSKKNIFFLLKFSLNLIKSINISIIVLVNVKSLHPKLGLGGERFSSCVC